MYLLCMIGSNSFHYLSQVGDGYLSWMRSGMDSEWCGKESNKQQQEANVQILIAALKACSKTPNLQKGKRVHAEAVEHGHDSNLYVATSLINMYAKCGSMTDARKVFDSMKCPNVVSWTVLISGYADNGQGYFVLNLFTKMRIEDINSGILVAVLKACALIATKGASQWAECRDRGKQIHNIVVETCCNSDTFVSNTLIDMYTKCGSMVDGREVFDGMKHLDLVSWNVLILGYADNGEACTALDLFSKMRAEGHAHNSITLVAALKACTVLVVKEGASRWAECSDRAKAIHNIALEDDSNSYVQNTLVDLYAKCGSTMNAREVFDCMKYTTVVSWTALILGYADNGQGRVGLDLFTRMKIEGPELDSVTLVAALKACTSLAVNEGASQSAECRDSGKALHSFVIEYGWNLDIYVQSSLVDMYAKCSSIVDAQEVFNSMKHPDLVSWTTLILGYTENGQGHTALELFSKMRTEGPAPDSLTFGASLKACGMVGALEFGRRIHSEIESRNYLNVVLVTCLVDFYAKCGSVVEAKNVFDLHAKTRNVITWNALLAGFSSCGNSETMFGLFEEMQKTTRPNSVTFSCLLTCCSHAGLVEKGKELFDTMSTNYGIIPTVEHYNSMVDIFGRANRFDEVMALLQHMPIAPNAVTWNTVLSCCRKWNNIEIGSIAFQCLIDMNDMNPTDYALMKDLYGSRET